MTIANSKLGKILGKIICTWKEFFGKGPFRTLAIFLSAGFIVVAGYSVYFLYGLYESEAFHTFQAYVYLGQTLLAVILSRFFLHSWLQSRALKEEPDYVLALITDARVLVDAAQAKGDDSDKYRKLKLALEAIDDLGLLDRTFWAVLPLSKALVDCYSVSELIAQTNLKLDDLQDYEGDDFTSYDAMQYEKKAREVKEAITSLRKAINCEEVASRLSGAGDKSYQENRKSEEENLRAKLKTLLIYVADLDSNFTRGSVLLSGVKFCCYFAVPLLLVMGLLPLMFSDGGAADGSFVGLSWYNYAFLSAASALVAVLQSFLGQEEVNVGNTQGMREVSKALIAASAGYFSGVAVYSLVASNLVAQVLATDLIPNLVSPGNLVIETWKTVFWALVAGFLFEKFINRIRSSADV